MNLALYTFARKDVYQLYKISQDEYGSLFLVEYQQNIEGSYVTIKLGTRIVSFYYSLWYIEELQDFYDCLWKFKDEIDQ